MENKVAKKAIETIDLISLINVGNIKGFDLKPFLFKGLLLKEKEFRNALKTYDFDALNGSQLYIFCSTDAIVPKWAYMLLASYLTERDIPHNFASSMEEAINLFVADAINLLDVSQYTDKRVVVKGCSGKYAINEQNYMKLTQRLKPVIKAISYGEACSMVPISKN
jgi:hypothetical protein